MHDDLQVLTLLDPRQRHGEPLALADQVQAGVGMEMAGAGLGLTAVDLLEVVCGLAMIGDQGQVDGQPLPAPPQLGGQAGPQRPVDAPLQLGVIRQRGVQRIVNRLLRRRILQAVTSGGNRGTLPGRRQENREQERCRAVGAVIAQLQVFRQDAHGVALEPFAVEFVASLRTPLAEFRRLLSMTTNQ